MKKYLILASSALFIGFSCSNKNKFKNDIENELLDEIQTEKATVLDENSLYMLVGTYTAEESEGVYVYQLDTLSGYSKFVSMAKVANPSYLAISKDEKYVYAVTEDEGKTSAANAFSFDKKEGKLKLINSNLTGGGAPCYISVDAENKHVITANYLGGNITLFNTKEDGSLSTATRVISFSGKGIDTIRQEMPHLHCVLFSPDQKYLYSVDLGTDKIHLFDVNSSSTSEFLKLGNPSTIKLKDASGPRHLTFHPNGKYAYLIAELSGAVIAFNYDDKNGNLSEFQSIQADTLNAKGSADIHISPDGKFLYASNRLKGDGIAIFTIDQTNGHLTKIGYKQTGVHPRNFIITPNGKFLLVACRDSGFIQIFERDVESGLLIESNKDISIDMPVCLKFVSFK